MSQCHQDKLNQRLKEHYLESVLLVEVLAQKCLLFVCSLASIWVPFEDFERNVESFPFFEKSSIIKDMGV